MSEDRFEGSAKQGVGRVQDAFGGLVGDEKTQAKGKVNQAAGSIENAYGQVKDQAQDAVNHVKDQAQDVIGQAKHKAEDAYSELEAYVREQPLAAVALGVGVGVVVGLLLRGGPRVVYVRK